MSAPVFLIGPPGVGKSTIGNRLARHYKWTFFDSDRIIEERSGVRICDIFEFEGESGFRTREARLLEELAHNQNAVISTGGGIILSETNREVMRENGLVVYLRAPIKLILSRTRYDKSRPLLQGKGRQQRLTKLMNTREPIYSATADLTIDVGRQSAAQLTKYVVERLEKYWEEQL